jgi:hypothetical protein
MIQHMSRIAAAAAAAAVSVMLFGGVAQADDPKNGDQKNQDGPDGRSGSATADCREVPPPEDGVIRCTAWLGAPGAGGQAVGY